MILFRLLKALTSAIIQIQTMNITIQVNELIYSITFNLN